MIIVQCTRNTSFERGMHVEHPSSYSQHSPGNKTNRENSEGVKERRERI